MSRTWRHVPYWVAEKKFDHLRGRAYESAWLVKYDWSSGKRKDLEKPYWRVKVSDGDLPDWVYQEMTKYYPSEPWHPERREMKKGEALKEGWEDFCDTED